MSLIEQNAVALDTDSVGRALLLRESGAAFFRNDCNPPRLYVVGRLFPDYPPPQLFGERDFH